MKGSKGSSDSDVNVARRDFRDGGMLVDWDMSRSCCCGVGCEVEEEVGMAAAVG